jgi:hypothetical protein
MTVSYVYAHEMQKVTTKNAHAIDYSHRQYTAQGTPVYTLASYTVVKSPDVYTIGVNASRFARQSDGILNVDDLLKNIAVLSHNVGAFASVLRSEYLSEASYLLQQISMMYVTREYSVTALQMAQNEVSEVNRIYNELNFIQRFLYRKQQKNRLQIAYNEVVKHSEAVHNANREIMNKYHFFTMKLRSFAYTVNA